MRLDPLWDELFPAEQARIVALLAERVDIGESELNVRLRVDGLADLTRDSKAAPVRPMDQEPSATQRTAKQGGCCIILDFALTC